MDEVEPLETKQVVEFSHAGKPIKFYIDRPDDHIQGIQSLGKFYEIEMLEKLRTLIPWSATVLDIGANVGNHTIYFGHFCTTKKIIPFEPNPRLAAVLSKNVALNNLANVDLSLLRFALGSSQRRARIYVQNLQNWGNGYLIPEEESRALPTGTFAAPVDVCTLDSLKLEEVHVIKIDVEGHEAEVLRGAHATIVDHRPVILVEIGTDRLGEIAELLTPLGYQAIDCFQQYGGQWNLLYVRVR